MKIVTSRFSEEELQIVRSIAPDVDFVMTSTQEELLREIEDADALYGPPRTPELIRRAKKLRWIHVGFVGINNYMFLELADSDIIWVWLL